MTTPQMTPVQLLDSLGITGKDTGPTTTVPQLVDRFGLTGGRAPCCWQESATSVRRG